MDETGTLEDALAETLNAEWPNCFNDGFQDAVAGVVAGTVRSYQEGERAAPWETVSQAERDRRMLNAIQHMLRDPEWGVGMLEDIADLVRASGRDVENLPDDEPTWDRH